MFGDRWSLLVLRDIVVGDRRYFRELQANSIEGIAPNILADRLKRLVESGLLTRECTTCVTPPPRCCSPDGQRLLSTVPLTILGHRWRWWDPLEPLHTGRTRRPQPGVRGEARRAGSGGCTPRNTWSEEVDAVRRHTSPTSGMGATQALAHPNREVRRLLEIARTWVNEPQGTIPSPTNYRTARQPRPDEIDKLVEAHRSGMPVHQIAKQFSMHRSTVGRHLSGHGVNTRELRLTPGEIAEAAELYRSGERLVDLANRYGVGVTTINRILVGHGVDIRPPGRRTSQDTTTAY